MSNKNNNENKFTTVKTIYARAAVVLLALNFCLTGYVIANMNEVTQELIDAQQFVTTENGKVAATTIQPTQ